MLSFMKSFTDHKKNWCSQFTRDCLIFLRIGMYMYLNKVSDTYNTITNVILMGQKERRNSSALAMELCLSCTMPQI